MLTLIIYNVLEDRCALENIRGWCNVKGILGINLQCCLYTVAIFKRGYEIKFLL